MSVSAPGSISDSELMSVVASDWLVEPKGFEGEDGIGEADLTL